MVLGAPGTIPPFPSDAAGALPSDAGELVRPEEERTQRRERGAVAFSLKVATFFGFSLGLGFGWFW